MVVAEVLHQDLSGPLTDRDIPFTFLSILQTSALLGPITELEIGFWICIFCCRIWFVYQILYVKGYRATDSARCLPHYLKQCVVESSVLVSIQVFQHFLSLRERDLLVGHHFRFRYIRDREFIRQSVLYDFFIITPIKEMADMLTVRFQGSVRDVLSLTLETPLLQMETVAVVNR